MNSDPKQGKQAYPLSWPDGWPRTDLRKRSGFARELTLAKALDEVLSEINRLNQRYWNYLDDSVVISTNIRPTLHGRLQKNEPIKDPGVAVYFTLRYWRVGKWLYMPVTLAGDRWDKVEDNLWAIGKHIYALRGQERWGVGRIEQAFRGYTAIPERTGGISWWEVLEVTINSSAEEIQSSYHRLAKIYHPDSGISPDHNKMVALNEAYRMAMPANVS